MRLQSRRSEDVHFQRVGRYSVGIMSEGGETPTGATIHDPASGDLIVDLGIEPFDPDAPLLTQVRAALGTDWRAVMQLDRMPQHDDVLDMMFAGMSVRREAIRLRAYFPINDEELDTLTLGHLADRLADVVTGLAED